MAPTESPDARFEGYDMRQGDPDKFSFDRSTVRHRQPTHPQRDGIEVLSLAFNANPFDHFRWMHANAPVYWDDTEGIWAVVGHADISRVEVDWQTFCSALGSRPTSSVPSMINMDPPAHTERRKMLSAGFTPRAVRAHEDFLSATVTELIDAVIDDGRCDFVTDIARPIPLRMIARLMDLPLADEEKLLHWSDLFAIGGEQYRDEVTQAVREWAEYIVAQMKTRTDPAADDLISLLLYHDGEPLTPDDLVFETMLTLVGGDETTRHVMAGGLEALLHHPDQFAMLRQDRSLLPKAIDEMLRWVTPVRNMNRTATVDTELGGQPILAGDRVLLLYQGANRDPGVFEDPYRFDITRDASRHVAFGGHGRHYCMGAQLAKLELRVLFEEVLDRLPEIALEEPDVWQPERAGNFVLGIDHLPVVW